MTKESNPSKSIMDNHTMLYFRQVLKKILHGLWAIIHGVLWITLITQVIGYVLTGDDDFILSLGSYVDDKIDKAI